MAQHIWRWAKKFAFYFLVITFSWVLIYRWVNPPFTLLMMQRYTTAVYDGKVGTGIMYEWAVYDEISSYMRVAVIATEDQNFPFHGGFDFDAIQKAIEYNQNNEDTKGASTISQQVAKNVFLWSGRNWLRKGLEAYFTILIELLWNKERILEMYLNVAEMGHLTFGVQAAAYRYYHIPARILTIDQAAYIAVILPNPLKYNPVKPSDYIRQRKNWAVSQIKKLGGKAFLKNI